MKRVALSLACALLLSFIASAAVPVSLSKPPFPHSGKSLVVSHKHKARELLVKFRPDVSPAVIDSIVKQLGAPRARAFRVKRGAKSAISRWRHVTLPPGVDVNDAMRRLSKIPGVEAVEPNLILSIAAVPNDPEFPGQWSLRNIGQEGGVAGADISAASAWDIQTGAPSVVIAVLDTGVDVSHPDLAPNLWVNPDEIPGNGIDDDGNGYVDDVNGYDFVDNDPTPDDLNEHGTHVAGIAAAAGNNGAGITGVAWNSKIMALKIFGESGTGDLAVAIDAILYAIDNGARILNNSWGAYGYTEALRDAVDAANDAGALFVAGAGNDSNDNDVTPFYPASFDAPNVVSVAATTRVDARSDFSNYGRATVDIGAPGTSINSTKPGGLYKLSSGTSMATPHVSGVAALLLSQSPELTAAGLKSLLLERSDSLASMHTVTTTGGRLNARASLDCNSSAILFGVRAPASNFVALEADPTLIRAQVSSCGHPVAGYSMSATFSNGDVELQLFDDGQHGDGSAGDGIFANYWMPQALGPVSVTIAASGGGPAQTTTRQGQVRQRVRYQHTAATYSWIDASAGAPHTLTNDGTVTLPIGFNFDFYGIMHDTITINANGLLAFGSSLPAGVNSRLPNPKLPNDLIAPFWDDYNPELGGAIYSLLQGTEPNRRLTVSWVDMRRVGSAGTASFQATLYEGSNDIIFQYQDVQFEDTRYDRGAGAIVGVEDPDGLDATVFSAYQRLLSNNTARRFYVTAAEPDLTYRVTVTTTPIVGRSGSLVMGVVDGDGTNNNSFSILQFGTDGDVILAPRMTGDASGSLVPGPAHIGDASFVNEISQPEIYGNTISFLMKVSRNGTFQPFPDAFAFYLLDSAEQPFPTSDPFGTDALFAIEVDRAQPLPQIFQSAYASATVETVGAPVARPGGPYTGAVNAPLIFDGSASSDPEGQPLNFDWNFGDGGKGTGVNPTHTYSATGTYTVTLVVDDVALYSAPATTTATIGASQAPIARAGPDQAVDQQIQVTLDGSASSDADGSIVSYSWRQTAGPAVTLSSASTATATFTSPLVSAQTTLTFELTVRDNNGDVGQDSVNVTVRKNNIPPTANAGPDQTVNEGVQVTLDGTGSSDSDGSLTSISWVQTGGPVAPLSAGSVPGVVHFVAPEVTSTAVLTFQVTVTDNGGATASDTVNVTVRNTNDPQANAGPDQVVDEQAVVTLNGTASSDPDGTIAGYSWVQLSGIAVTLNGANTATPSFTAPSVSMDQLLVFRLTVTDNHGRTGFDDVMVTVRNVNAAPTANAGSDKSVNAGSTVVLNGSGADPDGTIASYQWQQTAGPAVTLAGASSATASFTAPSVESDTLLVFQLTVTDNSGANASDSVNVTVVRFNQPPVANAGSDQTVNERMLVTLDGSGSHDPDGTGITYQWTQILGPTATLSDATAVNPAFTAPSIANDTTLRFSLRVTDQEGKFATDTVDILVRNTDASPVAEAGPDQTVIEGATVQLTGSGTDADGTVIGYGWTQISGPAVAISNGNSQSASFVAPNVAASTALTFRLTVTDDTGLTGSDTVNITVLDSETDTDGDGLPDGWEIQYFGNIASQNGNGDPDGDGLTNLQEYQSGSNPTIADGAPPAVTQASAKAGDTDVAITFGAAPGATAYDLYWGTTPSVTKATGTKIGNVTSPYLHSGRTNGTTYYYAVVAKNLHGESIESAVMNAQPGPRAWGTPATAVTSAGISEQIVGDEAGNGMIVYYRERVSNGPLDIYSVRYTPSGGWGSPVLIASTPNWQNAFYTSLKAVMNRRGDAVVTWMQDDGLRSNLWSSYLPAGASTWETPRLVENASGTVEPAPEVSIGDGGLMVAIWAQEDSGVRNAYASVRRPATGWSARVRLDPASSGNSQDVSVSADGAVGALAAWTRSSGTVNTVYGARYDGAVWQAPAVLFSDSPGFQGPTTVRTDGVGNGVVVYARSNSRGRWDVKASRYRLGAGWDSSPTVLDGSTSEVKGPMISMRKDGRAVVTWAQGTSLYANLMSASGVWSGAKALSKANGPPRGIAMDSLGRGLVVWSVTENSVENIYSALVSAAGWSGKLVVENATQSATPHGLIADDYGNATVLYREFTADKTNSFAVGNAGLGGGGGSGGGGKGGGGGGPKPKSSTTSTDGETQGTATAEAGESTTAEEATAAEEEPAPDEETTPAEKPVLPENPVPQDTGAAALNELIGGLQQLPGRLPSRETPPAPAPPEKPPEPSPGENPSGDTADAGQNPGPGMTLDIVGIQSQPTQGTDCQLPSSDIVDVFGVPKGDWIQARILFANPWEGTPKEFGVIAENSNIATTSSGQLGPQEKVTLTIEKGQKRSSPFYINGIAVDKTRLLVDAVSDDRDTPEPGDDRHYGQITSPIVVWDMLEEDIVDYSALGDSGAFCYDTNNSPSLVSDSMARLACGEKPDAVAADGTSYQLARLRAGSYGKACFTVLKEDTLPTGATDTQYYGRFSDPIRGKPGEFSATNTPTAFQAITPSASVPYYWALGTYTPPTDFFDAAATGRKVKIEVQFIPQDESGQPLRSNITAKTFEISIRRPPVLLVHGLWSSAGTWGGGFKKPGPSGKWRVDSEFSYPNDIPFSTTGPTHLIRTRLEGLIRNARELDRIATTKADIIGHSMGGLRARRWMSDQAYRSPSNYFEGNVRKLATVTTPHFGSPLANMLINLHHVLTDPDTHEIHERRLRWLEGGLPGGMHNGAVCELADNNPALLSGPIDGARAISFTATDGPVNDWAFLINLSLAVVLGLDTKSQHADPYLFNAANDKIVDLESQEGLLPVANNYPTKAHLNLQIPANGVTGASEVAKDVYAKLDTGDGWADVIPPRSLDSNGVIPRDNRGRGQDINGNYIDNSNYQVQCAPHGPMNVLGPGMP